MKTIYGVLHVDIYRQRTQDKIDRDYPTGVKSMLLELAPWARDGEFPFFDNIRTEYEGRGTKVIHGDINHPKPPEKIRALLREALETGELPKDPRFYFYAVGGYFITALDSMTIGYRDRGILKAVRTHNPEIAVVGRAHADYLKRKMPDTRYVAFNDPDLEKIWLYKHVIDPKLPDETIIVGK